MQAEATGARRPQVAVPWLRRPGSSCHVVPPSVVRNIAASSTPAYTVSGSVRLGSMCHTRLNSHGCGCAVVPEVRGGRAVVFELVPT